MQFFQNGIHILLKITLLNFVVFFITILLDFFRNIIELTPLFQIRFSFQLFVVAVFLGNLVYVVGLFNEIFHILIWKRKLALKTFESKYFKASLVMVGIVFLFGIASYFITFRE